MFVFGYIYNQFHDSNIDAKTNCVCVVHWYFSMLQEILILVDLTVEERKRVMDTDCWPGLIRYRCFRVYDVCRETLIRKYSIDDSTLASV